MSLYWMVLDISIVVLSVFIEVPTVSVVNLWVNESTSKEEVGVHLVFHTPLGRLSQR